jgi:hypothetical protein
MPKGQERPARGIQQKDFESLLYQAQETLGNCYMAETLRGFAKWDWKDESLPNETGSSYYIFEDSHRVWRELPDHLYQREQALLNQMDGEARKGIVKDFVKRYNCLPSEAEIIAFADGNNKTWHITIRRRAGAGETHTASGIVLLT